MNLLSPVISGRHVAAPTAFSGSDRELLRLDTRRPVAEVGSGQSVLIACRRGRVLLTMSLGEPVLLPGQALLCCADTPLRASVAHGGDALLLTLEPDLLRDGLRRLDPMRRFEPALLTARHDDCATLLGALEGAAASIGITASPSAYALQRCLAAALELDRRFDHRIARCPGRSAGQRRQVFSRFERTRQRFAWNPQGLDADVESLAASTHYTRWHFVRCFTAIYDQSPAEYMRDLRLRWCAEQLADSDLAISEIAWMAGYGSHASFARAFRSHYGRCASEWRARAGSPGTVKQQV